MSFLNKLQDKAQHALDKSGFASKIPGMTHTSMAQQPLDAQGNPVQGSASDRLDVPDGGKSGSGRGFLVENITHQLKSLGNQYAPQGPPDVQHVQVLITDAKGIALDYQGVGKDAQSLSKDFYLWGQDQEEDVKDVTDRLAYINFVHGNLATTLAGSLDAARAPFKRLRELLGQLGPRRVQLQAIDAQIRDLSARAGNVPGADKRISELQADRTRRVAEDEPLERELAIVKRKAIKDSEAIKWKAIKEYAEKLLLLSETSIHILDCLPSISPSPSSPYNAHATVAAARTTLQSALDTYQVGRVSQDGVRSVLDFSGGQRGKLPTDTRSFGESHQAELSRVSSLVSTDSHSGPQAQYQGGAGAPASHPLYPDQLNNSPAPIPLSPQHSTSAGAAVSPSQAPPPFAAPIVPGRSSVDGGTETATPPPEPTVAETGVPISAGAAGPGPAKGSLAGGRRGSGAAAGLQATGGGTLAGVGYVGGFRQEWNPPAPGSALTQAPTQSEHATEAPPFETAEDEKRRLEREERDKLLGAGSAHSDPAGDAQPPTGPPPSYQ